jgi:hypothetical protein
MTAIGRRRCTATGSTRVTYPGGGRRRIRRHQGIRADWLHGRLDGPRLGRAGSTYNHVFVPRLVHAQCSPHSKASSSTPTSAIAMAEAQAGPEDAELDPGKLEAPQTARPWRPIVRQNRFLDLETVSWAETPRRTGDACSRGGACEAVSCLLEQGAVLYPQPVRFGPPSQPRRWQSRFRDVTVQGVLAVDVGPSTRRPA